MRGDDAALEEALRRIDGRSYPAYRDLRGRWTLGAAASDRPLELIIDHVQGDPYAAPSRVRLRLPTGLDREITEGANSRRAAEDWLLRRFVAACNRTRARSARQGSGRSGAIEVLRPGPEVVHRSAVVLDGEGTAELRLSVGLPAAGRRVLGSAAAELLLHELPRAADTLREADLAPELHLWVQSVRVQAQLRGALREAGLVAFVADGSVLPRASGVDPGPLVGAVPFESPASLRCSLPTERGPVSGMGVPAGITVIAGGGFHGKSTLLQALQTGHRDHIPGDGRERVVSLADTVKVRAEDGRCIHSVDVSSFLGALPGGRSTRPLSTADASGSTSQAAAIVEAVQAGATVLLFDEDSCATNLMVQDDRMLALLESVSPHAGDGAKSGGALAAEPIRPLLHQVRSLWTSRGVSTVLVIGGVGDYLRVADLVVVMNAYRAIECTTQARAVAGQADGPVPPFPALLGRRVARRSLRPGGKGRVRARDPGRIEYGDEILDLRGVEQVMDRATATTLGHALRTLSARAGPPQPTVPALLCELEAILDSESLDALSPFSTPVGDLVEVRRHELASCLGRLRSARIDPEESP